MPGQSKMLLFSVKYRTFIAASRDQVSIVCHPASNGLVYCPGFILELRQATASFPALASNTRFSWLRSPFRGRHGVYKSRGRRGRSLYLSLPRCLGGANLVIFLKNSPIPCTTHYTPTAQADTIVREDRRSTLMLDELLHLPEYIVRNKLRLPHLPQKQQPLTPSHPRKQKP